MAGFIGSHLADRLLAEGHDVVGIDSFSDYYPREHKQANVSQARTAEKFRLVEADLNEIGLDEVVSDRQWIFHLAAQPGVRPSWGDRFPSYVRANIEATQRLLEASIKASGVERFIFASSSSVYGNSRQLPVHEDGALNPISPYGLTKLTGERLALIYAESFRLPVVALRYFTVYGPRQRPDMAFHRFGRALIEGDEIHVFGTGNQTRDFTYVSDVVDANVSAAKSEANGVFNIGGGSRISLVGAIAIMQDVSGRRANLRYEEVARGDVTDTSADISRARRAFGYQPKVGLRAGLDSEMAELERLYGGKSSDRRG